MKKNIYILLLISIVLLSAFLFKKFQFTGVTKVVKGTESIVLDLWLDEIPSTNGELFKNGDITNFVVRNRPHGSLQVLESSCVPLSTKLFYLRRVSVPTSETSLPAFKEPFLWQCRVKLLDNEALMTNNGYISHGNQLKIGNQISLEAALYRVDGFIVNIQPKSK